MSKSNLVHEKNETNTQFVAITKSWIGVALGFTRRHPVCLLLIVSFLYYLTFFNYGLDPDDEGFLLLNAESVLHGQWPMADFYSYQPLSYFLLALFFKVLGDSVFTERILLLILILINVWLVFYCARRLLPLRWAWLPAVVYAFAPGPWYKVFFISHMLLIFASFVYLSERPNMRRAFLVGIMTGIAAISRVEAAWVAIIIVAGLLPTFAWGAKHQDISNLVVTLRDRIMLSLRLECAFWIGTLIVVASMYVSYWLAGKLPAVLDYVNRYFLNSDSMAWVIQHDTARDQFNILQLFVKPTLEQWVYAVGMIACLVNFIRFSIPWLTRSPERNAKCFLGIAAGAFGVASMGYTYFYVWNSRMLSSFAIVYINYFMLLIFIYDRAKPQEKQRTVSAIVAAIGLAMIGYVLSQFIVVQNYSGSITTRSAPTVTVNLPKLRGIHIYTTQIEDIEKLIRFTRNAKANDYLVSMSESTTMGYLSGLYNPTYYRLFFRDLAPLGEQERAIRTFNHYHIRYFVARRSQFLKGGGYSSPLGTYAPKIKAYLEEKYKIIPLGINYVLLERKNDVSPDNHTGPQPSVKG